MAGNDEKPGAPLPEGVSRRMWLLNFGSAVLLSGFRGFPDGWPQQPTAGAAALPPGLYRPSLDHLDHALSSEGGFFPVPPGSETEYARPRSGPFVPQAFSSEEYRLLRRLVEILLGEDSRAAQVSDEVAEWIDLVVWSAPGSRAAARKLTPELRALAIAYFGDEEPVRQLETFAPEQICKEGFLWLNQEASQRAGKTFLAADQTVQAELVRSIADGQPARARNDPGARLFDFLKAETIRGFYTSRAGLAELGYTRSFYGSSPGCSLDPRSPG